jgi:NAD kinase
LVKQPPFSPTDKKILVDEEAKMLHTKVDLVVTLGGDGTVLWVSKSIYLIHFVKLPLKILVWAKL